MDTNESRKGTWRTSEGLGKQGDGAWHRGVCREERRGEQRDEEEEEEVDEQLPCLVRWHFRFRARLWVHGLSSWDQPCLLLLLEPPLGAASSRLRLGNLRADFTWGDTKNLQSAGSDEQLQNLPLFHEQSN